MRYVEGGKFTMGSDYGVSNHRPAHKVILSEYYIGETEVTQALWQAVMGDNPSYQQGDNLPVDGVSWNRCQLFIQKLNKLSVHNFALPTEAQWEYAARGGRYSLKFKYSGSDTVHLVGWSNRDNIHGAQPVGSRKPNELGLYDMSGNVSEWCGDWYGDYFPTARNAVSVGPAPVLTDPSGPSEGEKRVLRGGHWNDYGGDYFDSNNLENVGRSCYEPNIKSATFGLRLVINTKKTIGIVDEENSNIFKSTADTKNFIIAKSGESLNSISKLYNIPIFDILKNNEKIVQFGIHEGDTVFLLNNKSDGQTSSKTNGNANVIKRVSENYVGDYVIADGVKVIGDSTFFHCGKLTGVEIPNSVTRIGKKAFQSCYKLKSVNIPNNATTIGEYAFYSCKCLESVVLSNNLKNIGDGVFGRCIALKSIVIPNSVTSIGAYSFHDCTSLTSVTLSNRLKKIEQGLFDGCTSLTDVVIPEGVKVIGYEAFANCENLKSVTLPSTVTEIRDNAFAKCPRLSVIYVPNGSKDKIKPLLPVLLRSKVKER